MAFGIANPDTELHWFQTPPMSVQPEYIRPYTFSQISSRGALWEEDTGDLPQQTGGAGNITCDLSSKVSMGGIQNNQKYNFDVQSHNTSFVYNNNNINNFTEVPPAVQDVINNNTTQQVNNYYATGFPQGVTGSITTLSEYIPTWNNTNMTLTFVSKTTTFNGGVVTSIIYNNNVVITLTALKNLKDWYDTGSTTTPLALVSDVGITSTDLTKTSRNLVLSHGLITSNGTATTTGYASLTNCP